VVKAGVPGNSPLVEAISGDEPEMPPEGERLTAAEAAVISRWVAQGAVDDTPPEGLGTRRPSEPPAYRSLPAVPALAFSPDGALLAVAAHHEIIIHRGDGSAIIGRWAGDSPRIEALAFSRDGRFLAASGGAPSEFGEIQVWHVAAGSLVRSIRAGADTLYGVSWSDDGSRLAVGGADKRVRAFDAVTGAPVMQCDNHLDWVFGTAFVHDGSKLISISRDSAVKLIDVSNGHLIDDAARPREPVLAVARHPRDDLVAFTGTEGRVRLHRMAPRGGRLKEGDDKEESAVREFEHMATSLHAVAFNADGSRLACGGQSGEVRLFATDSGQRKTTIRDAGGPIFALAFHPTNNWLATAGLDGRVRFFDAADGRLVKAFPGVPVTP
jgi:WD40 repeat protein